MWPDYYQLIADPMAFEIVRQRVDKGHYKAVEPFYQDVMTIFENAMFYNEQASRIWKDAMVLKVRPSPCSPQPPCMPLADTPHSPP